MYSQCNQTIGEADTAGTASRRRGQETRMLSATFAAPPAALEISIERQERDQENARLRLALREAHHRSGNQWQLLLGLAELEQMQSPQADGTGCSVRLRAMMSAFATLNQALDAHADTLTGHQKVRVRAALESVLATLQAANGENVLSFTVQDAWLSEKGCAALLMACAELVCNATKYGRKTTQVIFGVEGGQGILQVGDDGSGFAADFRIEEQGGQGLQLVQALCRFDLNGGMRCHNSAQGGIVTLTFPVLSVPEEPATSAAGETFCGMEGIICFGETP